MTISEQARLKDSLKQLRNERRRIEMELRTSTEAAELNRKVIFGMSKALRLLKECRTNLKRVALVVSLEAYKDILANIVESEKTLQKAQAALQTATTNIDKLRHELSSTQKADNDNR